MNRFADGKLVSGMRKFAAPLSSYLDRILEKPWISYAVIAALQLKVIWNIWRYRDLTTGDTSSYFKTAAKWADHFAVDIVWSPLYTAFYGTLYRLTGDIFAATIAHRVIIVMLATLGVLALMRALLPSAIALLIAAWWAVLPINFETLYEVHLFALLPILVAWLVTTVDDTPWTRGIALAILLATVILIRNELIIAVVFFAVICLVREIRTDRSATSEHQSMFATRLAAYAIPSAVAVIIGVLFYSLSEIKYPQIMSSMDIKHDANMCQVYAFGYGQRHPEWTASPWLECRPLMQATFDKPWPSFREMIASNPTAVLQHVLWNLSLTPNGLQAALFNAMSGTVNPDYAPVKRNAAALYLSLATFAIVAAGTWKAAMHWNEEWKDWFVRRSGTWLAMLAVACVAVPVIMTQRPRPSYLFSLTVVLMAVVGSAGYVLLGRRWLILAKMLAVIGVPLLVLVMPSYYAKHRSDRPLYVNLERLIPVQGLLQVVHNRILFGDYNGEFRNYLQLSGAERRTFDYSLLQSWNPPQSLDQFLDEQQINVVFIQPRIMPELRAKPEARRLLDQPDTLGWSKLASSTEGEAGWMLLYREPRTLSPGGNR